MTVAAIGLAVCLVLALLAVVVLFIKYRRYKKNSVTSNGNCKRDMIVTPTNTTLMQTMDETSDLHLPGSVPV